MSRRAVPRPESCRTPPEGAFPDPGWGYNPGLVINSAQSYPALSFTEEDHPRDETGRWTNATVTETKANIGGSTGAKLVEMNGAPFVMKDYKGRTNQLKTEYIANQLYNEFGVHAGAPKSLLRFVEGKTVILNPFIKGLKFNQFETAADKNFVVDAWLANWDVAGLTGDNIAVDSNGQVHRLDNGGALIYRAQGGLKGTKFGPKVGELITMRDKNLNPSSANLFSSLTKQDIQGQISAFLNTYNVKRMTDIVKSARLPPTIQTEIIKTLDMRVRDLARQKDLLLSFVEELHPRASDGKFIDKGGSGLPTEGHHDVYKVGSHTIPGSLSWDHTPNSAQEIKDYLSSWISGHANARGTLAQHIFDYNSGTKFNKDTIIIPESYQKGLVPNVLMHAYPGSEVLFTSLPAPVSIPTYKTAIAKKAKPTGTLAPGIKKYSLEPSKWTPQTAEAFGSTTETALPGITLAIHDFVHPAKLDQIAFDLAQLNYGNLFKKGTLFVPGYYSKSTTTWLKDAFPGVTIKYKTTLGKLNPNNPKGKGYKGTSIVQAVPGQAPLPKYKQPTKTYKPEKPTGEGYYSSVKTQQGEADKQLTVAWHEKVKYEKENSSPKFNDEIETWFGSARTMRGIEYFLNTGVKDYNYPHHWEKAKGGEQAVKDRAINWNKQLDKAPKVVGVDLYRGYGGITPTSEYWDGWTTVGNEIDLHTTQASSRSSQTAGNFSAGNLLVKFINTNNAVDVAALSHHGEKEVFLRANTRYRIIKVEKNIVHGEKKIKAYVTAEQIHDKPTQ
jgi:hypothetical protein